MKDHEFLLWLRYRLINVYNESPNVDFCIKLEEIAFKLKAIEAKEIKDK